MSRLIYTFFGFLFLANTLNAKIIHTSNIEDIRAEVTENTLVLFNIAEVLMDTETSVGSQRWRQLLRSTVDSKTHDELTLYAFERVPPRTPEPATAGFIQELQAKGITTLALTSRGRHEWYSTSVTDIDLLTEKQLRRIDIDFSRTQLPNELSMLPELFPDYYHEGIVYATNSREKEDLIAEILYNTPYTPEKIILVDDKLDSLTAVETLLESLGIPFVGYAYKRTAENHAEFDPLIAIFQANWLFKYGEVLSDKEVADVLNWNILSF